MTSGTEQRTSTPTLTLPDGTSFALTRTSLLIRTRRAGTHSVHSTLGGALPDPLQRDARKVYYLTHIEWRFDGTTLHLVLPDRPRRTWPVPASHQASAQQFTKALLARQRARSQHRSSGDQAAGASSFLSFTAFVLVIVALFRALFRGDAGEE